MSEQYSTYLTSYQNLLKGHIAQIKDLLSDSDIKKLAWDYTEAKMHRSKKPFNVFTIASDLYYRENFHSDIIKVFLDPNESHNEGSTFLYLFIDFLNINYSDKVKISKQDYLSAIVEREPGKIDILIRSVESRHCIIIENKINNAGDMPRQLPRYYDYMMEQGYIIDAIVYLPLDINKQPDMSTWSEMDKQHVISLLCILPAYKKNGKNLVDGWIDPCILKTKNIDCISVLRQYGELIKLLSENNMDTIILNKFYQSLLEEKSIDAAISISNMLQEMPIYMADRLCDYFKLRQGDYDVWKWKPNFCGICFNFDGVQHKIDIWTSINGYSVHVFGQNQTDRLMNWTEGLVSLSSFIKTENEYKKCDFSFYDEDKVIACVNAIIEEVRSNFLKR